MKVEKNTKKGKKVKTESDVQDKIVNAIDNVLKYCANRSKSPEKHSKIADHDQNFTTMIADKIRNINENHKMQVMIKIMEVLDQFSNH